MQLYFERLTLISLLFAYHKKYLKEISNNKGQIIHYVDASKIGRQCGRLFGKIFDVEFQQLKFKMMAIQDENGELVRVRIPRKDLFDIQNKIIHSVEYQKLFNPSWKEARIENFLKKGIVGGSILDNQSCSRILYLINVINWHQKRQFATKSKLIINRRGWFRIFKDYASNLDVELIETVRISIFNLRNKINQLLLKTPYLYILLRNIKQGKFNKKLKSTQTESIKLYLEGRGDVNIVNNGHHSDFFWEMNSDFDASNILYDPQTEEELLLLRKKKICVSDKPIKFSKKSRTNLTCDSSNFREEREVIQKQLSTYNLNINLWYSFFKQYNVKVCLTWFKYDNLHMPVADAISECGGISAIWQLAFDGFPAIDCETNADIIFSHSLFSHKLDKKLESKYSNYVITGYPKDYSGKILKKEASKLRNKLFERGVKKIVFSIDENSNKDSRWHSGHELQRENYSFILEKVLETPWLGVIFKPKHAKSLRLRLGATSKLLDEAIKTGRCFIFESSGRHTTIASPLVAGLAADVCIHGHLSAGTAALECALENKPTLLIDREGCPESKFYELPKEKVIFKNWEDTIDALMEHLRTPNGIPGFGDWNPIINDLDPFRDGKAAQRMGNYLHWLIQGFEQGHEKGKIMADVTERYAKEWGSDKVIIKNH
jgi:hypothetical protein